jgi:hypothetical protein
MPNLNRFFYFFSEDVELHASPKATELVENHTKCPKFEECHHLLERGLPRKGEIDAFSNWQYDHM